MTAEWLDECHVRHDLIGGMKSFALKSLALLAVLAALSACQTGDWWPREAAGSGASASAATRLAEIRASAGLGALAPDDRLEKAAARQAAYMAASGRMEHTTGPGRDFVARMKRDSIAAPAAENLANGRMDTQRLFSMWMDSPGHRRNMLDARFSRYGLAYAEAGGGRRYWALVLGR
jgi:uncharacterized protein YkwD